MIAKSTLAVLRSGGGLSRPARQQPTRPQPTPKPFHQESAKEQMKGFLKIAGGKGYIKSPIDKELNREAIAFRHGEREGFTKEQLYALGKYTRGGVVTKEGMKKIAAAATHIARMQKQAAGGLASGMSSGTDTQGGGKLIKIQAEQTPQHEAITRGAPTTAQNRASLQERLHIQHAPITGRQPSTPAMGAITPLSDTPNNWSAAPDHQTGTPHTAPVEQTAPTPPPAAPAAPKLSQFSAGFTGGTMTEPHQPTEPPSQNLAIPTLRGHDSSPNEPPPTAPAEPANEAHPTPPVNVDEGLPF